MVPVDSKHGHSYSLIGALVIDLSSVGFEDLPLVVQHLDVHRAFPEAVLVEQGECAMQGPTRRFILMEGVSGEQHEVGLESPGRHEGLLEGRGSVVRPHRVPLVHAQVVVRAHQDANNVVLHNGT